jgi:hypothetical protein
MTSSSHDYIVQVPAFFKFIRFLQLVLTVGVAALTIFAFGISNLTVVILVGSFVRWAVDYLFFVCADDVNLQCALTLIAVGYYILSTTVLRVIYNRWLVWLLEIAAFCWWIGCTVNQVRWAIAYASLYTGVTSGSTPLFSDKSWYGSRFQVVRITLIVCGIATAVNL